MQKTHCYCESKKNAIQSRIALVSVFYKGDLDKAKELVENPKYVGEKFYKLYYALLKKYDHMIQHIGPRADVKKVPGQKSSQEKEL